MLLGENSTRFVQTVENQYYYKIRIYLNFLLILILVQIMAAIFTLPGLIITDFGISGTTVNLSIISSQIIIAASAISALIIPISMTNMAKDLSFGLPCNRFSDALSDIAVILSGCIIGGVSSSLLYMALHIPIYFLRFGKVLAADFYPSLSSLCLIAAYTALYMFLAASAGYFFGTLIRINKNFALIFPALFPGMVFIKFGNTMMLIACCNFFFADQAFSLRLLKVLAAGILFFIFSAAVTCRMEVRKV